MSAVRFARDAALFAFCYVALDWASYIDPLGPSYITPWNPQPALALAWMLLGGMRHVPVVLATVFAADILIRGATGGLFVSFVTSVTLAGGYAWIAWVLRSLLGERGLRSLRQLTVFVCVVVGGTAVIGAVYVGLLRAAELLDGVPLSGAWVRFWIGDAVGVLVTMPLLLALSDAERRSGFAALLRRHETWLQALTLGATIWLIFWGLGGDPGHHFYALFLPLIWIAARGGLNGAVGAIAIVQLGVFAGIHNQPSPAFPALEIQALVAALALTALYLGMMVEERARAEESLRQSLRLAAAGDMAGAIAHEINQPLTALANYGQSALVLLASGSEARERVPEVISRMLEESRRAAEVVRRLRDFFRAGTTRLEELPAEALMATVRRIGQQIIGGRAIALELDAEPDAPALYVDRLQIELVIRNLIANAVEALEHASGGDRRIHVRLRRHAENELSLAFVDSGPGLRAEMIERVFEPFVSGKPTGMGLGLAISRAIAEAHGGALEARPSSHGEFRLLLPCFQAS